MSKKLLLADDSITIQKVVGITFANEDIELAVADNGADALDKAQSDPPDLILADVHMPEIDGYELTEAVKKDQALRQVPVLLLTGTFESFDEERAHAVGADDWIAKPFESQALIEKVRELLERAAQAPEAVAPAALEAGEAKPEPEPAEEDIWSDFTFEEDEMAAEPAPAAADEPEETEDILELDEADIVEEDFAEGAPEEAPPLAAEEEPFAFAESASVEEPPAEAEEPSPFDEEEESASFGVVGSLSAEESTVPVGEEVPDFTEADADEFAARAETPAAPAPQIPDEAAAPPVAGESRGAALSEEETARIVERVANEVVERLAGTIIEKIAWEVVPDLAESIIRDEIRKIREALK